MTLYKRLFTSIRCVAAGLAFLISGAGCMMAQAADMPEYAQPPASQPMKPDMTCYNQHVLSRVSYYFYHQVRNVPGLPMVRINAISNIKPQHYDPAVNRYAIARHYCTATAHMNDGTSYQLAYMVADGQSFAGFGGFNVDFCVEGFDKWRVHNYDCRTVRWDYLNRNFNRHADAQVY